MPKPKKAAGGKAAAQAPEEPQEAAPDAPASQQQEGGAAPAKEKKKRNNNPGVRVQGGRVYDSENGTTCHQCRQKTAEQKAKCTACTLYFCPKCLENRYQEQVETANAAGDWRCPRCRGDCNCSNCRKKAGKEATGQLANIAKKAGFGSVKSLLEKNPHAKALQLPRAPSAPSASAGTAPGKAAAGGGKARGKGPASASAGDGEGDEGAGPSSQQAAAGSRARAAQKRKAAAAAAEEELIEDEALPPREQEMPEAQPLAVHKSAAGGGAAGARASRRQGGMGAWAAGVPEVVAVPAGEAGAELAVVLEFLQVFGPKLQLRASSLPAFAAELLQPAVQAGEGAAGIESQLLCPRDEESLVGAVHCRLLQVVREYWNVKGAVSPSGWQPIMTAYYAASLLTQQQALGLRWQHGPPAVAGEIFTRPAGGEDADGAEEMEGEVEVGGEGATQREGGADGDGPPSRLPSVGEGDEEAAAQAALGAAPAVAVGYPAGGYWALQPAERVGMLHALLHDALDCGELREFIESTMGDAAEEEKERRQQLAGVRKEAREAMVRERDQQIALLIANASGGLTLEQQQQLLEQARQRAEAAATTAAAAKVKALAEKVHPPTVRAAVVGSDREGRRFLQLQSAPLLTGGAGIVVQLCGADGSPRQSPAASTQAGKPSGSSGQPAGEALSCYAAEALPRVAAALHPQGRREGPLRAALVRTFKLSAGKAAAEQQQQEEEQGGSGSGGAGSAGGSAEREGSAPAPGGNGAASEEPAAAPPTSQQERAAKRPAAGRRGKSKSKSPSAGAESPPGGEEAGQQQEAAAAPPAAKRSRQGSEAGSSAERAAPSKRRRAAAPAPAEQPAKQPAGGRPRRAGAGAKGKAAAAEAAQAAASEGEASLPLKVDDMLQ